MVLRMSGPNSKVCMFAYSGHPAHLKAKTLTREEFIEEFYTVTGRRDVKFGEVKWLSSYTYIFLPTEMPTGLKRIYQAQHADGRQVL
jgi:hypothetical protein